MAKSISSALAAHLASEVTTLATCWRVTRKDGRQFFFTDHDRDLAFGGNLYLAASGYSRTAIANDAGMAVDNLDVEGVLDHEQISEQDLRAGLFDQAQVHVFLVNWADLSQGKLRLRRGWFGEVHLTDQGLFRTELQPGMPRRSRRSSLPGADRTQVAKKREIGRRLVGPPRARLSPAGATGSRPPFQ